MDLTDFISAVQHKECILGTTESCSFRAYDVDGDAGLCKSLGYKNHEVSKVDYLLEQNNFATIALIELTDLDSYKSTQNNIIKSIQDRRKEKPRPTRKELQAIHDKLWDPIKTELRLKWNGSLAIAERLCRFKNVTTNPAYIFIIICKNNNDVKLFDGLIDRIRGNTSSAILITSKNSADRIINKLGFSAL